MTNGKQRSGRFRRLNRPRRPPPAPRGTRNLGLDGDIGSLQEGKLADLIVLETNPLDDLRNSEHIRWTMVNGRLFEARTMDQVGHQLAERESFYWEGPGEVTQPFSAPAFLPTYRAVAPSRWNSILTSETVGKRFSSTMMALPS